jgi:hypothetical protein
MVMVAESSLTSASLREVVHRRVLGPSASHPRVDRPTYVTLDDLRRGGGTGRRTGLKIPGPQGRAGSIPAPGTNFVNDLPLLRLVGVGCFR